MKVIPFDRACIVDQNVVFFVILFSKLKLKKGKYYFKILNLLIFLKSFTARKLDRFPLVGNCLVQISNLYITNWF